MNEHSNRRRGPITEEEHKARIRRARRKKRLLRQRRILLGAMGLIACGILFFCYSIFYDTVYKTSVVEAGYTVQASDLEKRGFGNIAFASDAETIDTTQLGVQKVKVKKGFFTHTCEVKVQDTKAPVAQGKELTIGATIDILPEECVENATDVTALSYKFIDEINREIYDTQNIAIEVKDEAGNATRVESKITVSDDVEPPVIRAPEVLESGLGEAIAYKQNIKATDNSEKEVELAIDNSKVDIDTEGDYVVNCTATDWVGNKTSLEVKVRIVKKTSEQAAVEGHARDVLAQITNDSMSEYEICEAIFKWCQSNIAYSGHSEKGDWIAGANDGFVKGSGDCYTYFATAKVLLTQAGIKNMDIEKIPAETSHYWNLVDLGDGWIHFDTTRRADGTKVFLWSDEKLMAYSNSHKLSHNYDPDLYPEIS